MATEKVWKCIWADGRAVQYFRNENDARLFARNYRTEESSPPVLVPKPAGARVKDSYAGPHKNVAKRQMPKAFYGK